MRHFTLLTVALVLTVLLSPTSFAESPPMKLGVPKIERQKERFVITIPVLTPEKSDPGKPRVVDRQPTSETKPGTKKPSSGSLTMQASREKVSGMTMLVLAYLFIWAAVFGYMLFLRRVFRRQERDLAELNARLRALKAEKS